MSMRFWRFLGAVALVDCLAGSPPEIGAAGLEGLAKPGGRQHGAACGFCADVAGKNDLKHLCPDSKTAWDGMVNCVCMDKCSAECGADWCARLGDVAYSDASDACNNCAISKCWAQLSACSDAM